jgi:hypothetical protein
MRGRVDARVPGLAFGDGRTVALDQVLEAEPRTPDASATGVHGQPVGEARRLGVADPGVGDERFDASFPEGPVAPCLAAEVIDARDLEPDEVDAVVCDALRVGLGETNLDLDREVETFHRAKA